MFAVTCGTNDVFLRGAVRAGSAGRAGGPFYSEGSTDPAARLVRCHKHDRAHMSLNEGETPAQTFAKKMPPPDAECVGD